MDMLQAVIWGIVAIITDRQIIQPVLGSYLYRSSDDLEEISSEEIWKIVTDRTVSIDIKKDLFGANEEAATINAEIFQKHGIKAIDIMGSVGTGKTQLIEALCERLSKKYPDHLKDLWGDLGVCVYEFEIWKSICLFDYAYLSADAIDTGAYLIISLEKLLFMKALAMKEDKYHKDLEMIVRKILDEKYAAWWAQLSEAQHAHYQAQKQ